jgi:hypothetical protein
MISNNKKYIHPAGGGGISIFSIEMFQCVNAGAEAQHDSQSGIIIESERREM